MCRVTYLSATLVVALVVVASLAPVVWANLKIERARRDALAHLRRDGGA